MNGPGLFQCGSSRILSVFVYFLLFPNLNRHLCHGPPDPINHVCSLTGKYIPQKCFTYRSVQIFKIMFRRFLFSRIWSSAQDHAVLVLLLNLLVFSFPTDRICQVEMICIGGVPLKNSFSAGPDLNHFSMIHRGGRVYWELFRAQSKHKR